VGPDDNAPSHAGGLSSGSDGEYQD
jgi:hypothetical protein